MSQRTRPNNVSSMLLNGNENESLFQVLGRGCVTLATGVVQLYLAESPDRTRWNKRCCGVACFVKDNPKRSYFIRVFDIKKGQQIWEQELYNQFRYKTPRDYFHTFEAHDNVVGLNFASEDEANKFKNAVEGKLQERQLRRREKKRQPTQHASMNKTPNSRPPNIPQPSHNNMMSPPTVTTNLELGAKNGSTEVLSKKDKKKGDKKGKLTKADIGAPTEFRHVSHVGWDPNKGFDMNNLDSDMQQLFQSVGISGDSQVDKETVDFIYDFVEKHGGIEAVRAPPPPSRGPVPPPPSRAAGVPPPPHRGNVPPPPPPGRGPNAGRTGMAPPPPSRGAGTPMKPGAAPPPPPSSAPRLKKVDQLDTGGSRSGNSRGQLLDAIRHGAQLKPVDHSTDRQSVVDPTEQEGLVGALARALALRNPGIHGSGTVVADPEPSIARPYPMVDQDNGGAADGTGETEEGLVGALARALKGFRPLCVDSGETSNLKAFSGSFP
ncbi:hypothetical protein BaRGS_00022016 [Batillaria attramentaria]|uniref:Uncharacterized protein n=1 Tax=Batillaria attramentaria TaxID=370345 RepID=A0ABD0KI79_9CAEN